MSCLCFDLSIKCRFSLLSFSVLSYRGKLCIGSVLRAKSREVGEKCNRIGIRAREILKSESVQPMTMTSSMSPFPKKKNVSRFGQTA